MSEKSHTPEEQEMTDRPLRDLLDEYARRIILHNRSKEGYTHYAALRMDAGRQAIESTFSEMKEYSIRLERSLDEAVSEIATLLRQNERLRKMFPFTPEEASLMALLFHATEDDFSPEMETLVAKLHSLGTPDSPSPLIERTRKE